MEITLKETKKENKKMKIKTLTEDQKLYLETIEHIENELIKGTISDKQFHDNMGSLKNQFND